MEKRNFSFDAVRDFEDCSLDFVYVDAVHDFEGVREEERARKAPRLRPAPFTFVGPRGYD